jgi:hypothetical protein
VTAAVEIHLADRVYAMRLEIASIVGDSPTLSETSVLDQITGPPHPGQEVGIFANGNPDY